MACSRSAHHESNQSWHSSSCSSLSRCAGNDAGRRKAAAVVSLAGAISTSKGRHAYGETVLGFDMVETRLVVWAEAFEGGGNVYHLDSGCAAFGDNEAVLFPAGEGAAAGL